MGTVLPGMPERSSVGIYEEKASNNSVGDIVFFLLYVVVNEYGKVLDRGYVCPLYCEVDHTHRYEKTKSHIQTTNNLPGWVASEDREPPEVNIRTGPYVHRLRRNEKAIRKAE